MKTLKQVLETEKVKFTKPQQKIVDRLLRGDTITVVNAHRMNGGDMMWRPFNSQNLEHAGKVYKAFWNVGYQIKKQTGNIVNMSQYIN